MKGALVKQLQVGRGEMEKIDAPRARSVVRMFHALTRDMMDDGADSSMAIERLSDDLRGFLSRVAREDWPQKECTRLLVELWNGYVQDVRIVPTKTNPTDTVVCFMKAERSEPSLYNILAEVVPAFGWVKIKERLNLTSHQSPAYFPQLPGEAEYSIPVPRLPSPSRPCE